VTIIKMGTGCLLPEAVLGGFNDKDATF